MDIIAENELDEYALFIEVKRNITNFNPDVPSSEVAISTRAIGEFKKYTIVQQWLSNAEM